MKLNQLTQSKLARFANLRQAAVIIFFIVVAGGFTASRGQNPAPTLTSISPNSAQAGTLGVTLTATGFNRFSTVQWNGADLPTNFVTTAQLTATVPASNLASAGTANVTVFNPPPSGWTNTGSHWPRLTPLLRHVQAIRSAAC